MAWRHVMVVSPARLETRQSQLVIKTAENTHTLPMEDISTLLVESQQSVLTAALLSSLAQHGVALLVCDKKHLPCAVLLPYAQHSRPLAVLKRQLSQTKPSKNRLWQQLVRAKIQNQARCLELLRKKNESDDLMSMAAQVQSGDKGRLEGVAAARYFPAVFGKGFYRAQDNGINAALNYGYAIIRGCMARTLSAYGFLPYEGLSHHNELNPFNLADDMMEPFRPAVDLFAAMHMAVQNDLTQENRRLLLQLLACDMLSGGERHTLANSMERAVQSLARCMASPKEEKLMLPTLLPLQPHSYA